MYVPVSKYKILQMGTFIAFFILFLFGLFPNISRYASHLPTRDFVIFLQLFSLIAFLLPACTYFALRGVYRRVRIFTLALIFGLSSVLSLLNPWYLALSIFSAISIISAFKVRLNEESYVIWIPRILIGLLLLPLITSLAFTLVPVEVGTTGGEIEISFWAEGVPPRRERVLEGPGRPTELIYPENIIDEEDAEILRNRESKIYLAIHQAMLHENSPAEKVTERLNRWEVPVKAWLLARPENFYWANNLNFHVFDNLYDEFLNWKGDLKYDGLVLDKELDVWETERYLTKTMGELYRTDIHERSVENYGRLIERISEEKSPILTTWGTPCLDDFMDRDPSLQKLLGISAVPPDTWDEYSFQVYRVIPYRTVRLDLGSYLVYSYSVTAREVFGNDVAIGLSHAGFLGYSDITEIVKDVRVVNALDIREAQVYSIEQVKRFFGTEGLERILENGRIPNEEVTIRYHPVVPLWRFPIAFFDMFI